MVDIATMHVKFLLPNGNSVNHQLPEDRPRHIVLRSDRLAVTPSLEDGDHEYGRISTCLLTDNRTRY